MENLPVTSVNGWVSTQRDSKAGHVFHFIVSLCLRSSLGASGVGFCPGVSGRRWFNLGCCLLDTRLRCDGLVPLGDFHKSDRHSAQVLALLTHWGWVTHICVIKLSHHWFRYWLFAWPAPTHNLKQCWNIINWTPGNTFQWNFHQNTIFLIHENAFENVV